MDVIILRSMVVFHSVYDVLVARGCLELTVNGHVVLGMFSANC